MPSDPQAVALAYLEAVGEKQFDRVSELLHPDMEFEGPNMRVRGADDYLSALRGFAPILLRNEIRKAFVDGDDVAVIYDFVTDTTVGAVPTVEWLTIENGRIRHVRLIFHSAPWPAVMAELQQRVKQAA